ncbi:2'-deoxycytidine 5'-triphosphate deaminase [Hyphococcus luteus]|uniref:2'-deoxycytidine 5'-triphosphate deaminase n=1 Tax=Hyphococcus luteus TaxID=2058213 RepID=A0A2S7K5X1_9PROT|nr:2'-deoxycytidine 5'-triphosphate deaminase [Marinicaulis flavus]PQA87897.1 2'-deoxycytidine 5'-triphosphate deaminase [Marinicaulis flavus]
MAETRLPDKGVLASQDIAGLIDAGVIVGADRARLQPASLDLTLSPRAWRVRASFLPSRSRTVEARLTGGLAMQEMDISGGAVFERGCVYLVELNEKLSLPKEIEGAANPKSSTGRIDVFVRLVTDYGAAFDEIPAGYEGPLYAEISPRTFSILARAGSSLNQLRLKAGDCRLDDGALRRLNGEIPLVEGAADINGGLGLSVCLASKEECIGWRARRHSGLIDVDKVAALDPHDYFEPLAPPKSGFVILDPDEFYILASKEALAVPPDYAAEMTPISPGLGEFRVHYAGFFDPGFGWSPNSEGGGRNGSRGVLEVRSHDAPFVLEDGQLVARLVYERMAAQPEALYGEGIKSNYQGQGLKLSKHFR